MTEYLKELLSAEDKFAFVVADPLSYRLACEQDSTERLRAHLRSANLSDRDAALVTLGILFVSRRQLDLRQTPWRQDVDSIIAKYAMDRFVRVRAGLTKAAILYTTGQIVASYEAFEASVLLVREGDDHFAYALGSKGLADAAMELGDHSSAQEHYENALATFRRYGYELPAAFVVNNLGILMKRLGQYQISMKHFSNARRVFSATSVNQSLLDATNNLGIACIRLGEWNAARRWLGEAQQLLDRVSVSLPGDGVRWGIAAPLLRLEIAQRKFGKAETGLKKALSDQAATARASAILNEFLGELYTELGDNEQAEQHFQRAMDIASDVAPAGDVMSEILRRQAQLYLCQGHLLEAGDTALRCMRLSRRIGDRYEYGAALRVLGEVQAAKGSAPKAAACFRAAVHTLKSIHECYELMRTLYAQGKLLATIDKQDEAEIALLEARQLSKKLELEYYQALIAIAMVDTIGPQERFEEAQSWVEEATTLRDHLEGVDRERVDKALKRAANDLQKLITAASVKSAETLKTICRVYEDARFPFEDMRADLAYQVAQSIDADCLFVVGRCGGGYRVPITYNISVNDSKEIVRRLDRILRSKSLLDVEDEPQILSTIDGRTLLAVPCREPNGNRKSRKSGDLFVACARFDASTRPGPRQIELMCASAEALARLIEEDDLRPARKPSSENATVDDDADDERVERIQPTHPRGSFKSILTIDPEMIKLIRTAERAAESVAPILLEGETGVGKELFARAIHGASRRKDGPFVAINAGGMSVHLLESELFGHVKGAFTDAGNDRTGLVDTARGGTLFFDEVGEMGEEMQVKLLRLMENGEYRRLGESSTRKADVRVISATNRDLKKDSERGLFRRDLYYRLSPLKLTIPPLRLRACDIQLMTRNFLRECAAMNGIADRYIEIDVKAMEALEVYDWPGNVRELHNEILRVVSLIGRGDMVRFAMLSDTLKDFLKSKKRVDGLLDRSVEQFERRLILDALEKNDWNKLHTADAIGVPRTTLLAKLKRMNIPPKI
jgi:DNA-binding NtrC family response regulator/tetratricopeptide (TPR) repeat protein